MTIRRNDCFVLKLRSSTHHFIVFISVNLYSMLYFVYVLFTVWFCCIRVELLHKMGTHRATESTAQRREQSKLLPVSYVACVIVIGGFVCIKKQLT